MEPPPSCYTAETLVPLRIEAADIPARQRAKAAGGRWDPRKRLWLVKYGKVSGTETFVCGPPADA